VRSVALLFIVAVCVLMACAGSAIHDGRRAQPAALAPLPGGQHGTVKRVVDGDTVYLTVAGQDVKVRLIGINTPETVKPGTPVMCGGKEASANMHRLATVGARARLVSDAGPGTVDKYHRQLRYLYVHGVDVNAAQVRAGWAQVNGYGHRFRLSTYFKRLQRRAKARGLGVWSECGGNFNKPAR
jgi:micrococcal nuclease